MKIYHLNPPSTNAIVTADSVWMAFKTFLPQYDWVTPIYDWDAFTGVDAIADEILSHEPDVLSASIYVWNEPLVLAVINAIKTRCTDGPLVVVGGPQVPDTHEYLIDHPNLDIVCTGTGELFFEALLQQLSETGRVEDVTQIPFALTRTERSPLKPRFTWSERNGLIESLSYLYELKAYAQIKQREFCINYETTRGCPYACTYCEWGGGVGTRIVAKEMSLVKDELETLLGLLPDSVGILDANFGILKRDLEILDVIGESKQLTNYPRCLDIFGLTKSKMAQREAVLDKVFSYGLEDSFFLALQSSSDKTLNAIKRTDINRKEYLELFHRMRVKYPHISVKVELILGLPNSTLSDFYEEMNYVQLADSWQFKRYMFFLLPNSEASRVEYRYQYGIQTSRYDMAQLMVGDVDDDEIVLEESPSVLSQFGTVVEVVNATRSYSREDWMAMHCMNTIQDFLGPYVTKRASVIFPRFWETIRLEPWYLELDNFYQAMFSDGQGRVIDDSLACFLQRQIGCPKSFVEKHQRTEDPLPFTLHDYAA